MGESRRDRLRAATVREISDTARRILVEQGPDSVTLRAIAREMGMTAPALYRYFDSHGELLRHVVGDLFTELIDALHQGMHDVPHGDMSAKFLTVSRQFRHWSLDHPREYALLFGAPVRGIADRRDENDFAEECARRFGWTFMALFLDLWQKAPFPVPADGDIDPVLLPQLRRYRDEVLDVGVPLGLIQRFLQSWIRLQGGVSLEVFGHLEFALDDAEPMFELMLMDVAQVLGLSYTPPPPH